jgi:hypothetical protein
MKSRQLRERYKQHRRRQTVRTVACGTIVISVLALVVLLVVLVRACSGIPISGMPRFERSDTDPRWAHEIAGYHLRPAPWFFALDDGNFFVAGDTQQRDSVYPVYHVDSIACYPLDGQEPSWTQTVDTEISRFGLAGDMLTGFRQYVANPPRLEVICYSKSNGVPEWTIDIADAQEGEIITDGEHVVLAYYLPDGHRLAGYNTSARAKAWGMRLPLDGLVDDLSTSITLRGWKGVAAYQIRNVIGLVDTGSGQRLREYAASGYILDFELDLSNPDDRVCYLLLNGNQRNMYKVMVLPFRGNTRDLQHFESIESAEDIGLLAADGHLLLSYLLPAAESPLPRTRVMCYARGNPEPVVRHEVEGVVTDALAVPGRVGEFLLVVHAGVAETGLPVGDGTLYYLDANPDPVLNEDGELLEEGKQFALAGKMHSPVMHLLPFKEDCLVMMFGGDIASYIPEARQDFSLFKTRYPMLKPIFSPSGEHLAVVAYTENYLLDRTGTAVQVIVFE